MSSFEKFEKYLARKEEFCSSMTGKKVTDEEHEYVLNVCIVFK